MTALPLWGWLALVNAAAILAFLVTVVDEFGVSDDWPPYARWSVRGLLVLVAFTLGAPLVLWVVGAEWYARRRSGRRGGL